MPTHKMTTKEIAANQAKIEWITMIDRVEPLTNYCKSQTLNLRGKERKALVKRIEELNNKNGF